MNTLKNKLVNRTIKPAVAIAIVALVALSGASVIQANSTWTAPTQAPPLGNPNPPLNDSSDSQVKTGGLSLGSLIVNGGSILDSNVTIDGDLTVNNSGSQGVFILNNNTSDSFRIISNSANTYMRRTGGGGIFIDNNATDGWNQLFLSEGGPVGINTGNVTSGLQLDVEGNIGAALYCDENATSCFDPATVVTSSTSTGTIGFWSEAGGNVYRSTGNVGIGTAAPTVAELTVVNSSAATENAVVRIESSAGRHLSLLQPDAADGNDPFTWVTPNSFQWRVDAVDALAINSAGDVIVGGTTANGTLLLDVNGQVGATEYCDAAGANCTLASNLGGGLWEASGADVYRPSGEVGIGITNPGASLDTAGDIRVGGNDIFFGGGQFLNTGSTAYLRFQSNHATISGIRLFDSDGDEYGRVYGAQGDNIGFLDGDGAWGIRHVKDTYTQFRVNNVENVRFNPNQATFYGGLYAYTDLTDTDFFVRDSDKGSVSNTIWYDYSTGRVYLGNTGGSGTNPEVTVRGDLQADGEVGIGETSPDAKLHVKTTTGTSLGNDGVLTLENTLNATNGYTNLRFVNPSGQASISLNAPGSSLYGGDGLILGTFSGDKNIAFVSNNATKFIFEGASGDVGIGDITPDGTLKLDVAGQIGATEYCDENGANCTAAGSLSGASLWTDAGSYIRHVGNVAATGWVGAGCESGCDGDGNYFLGYGDGHTVVRHTGNSAGIDVSVSGTNYGIYGLASQNHGVYGRTTSASHGGVLGYSGDASVYGILAHANAYSLYGNGQVWVTSHITSNTGNIYAGGRHLYFGNTSSGQDLYGDNGSYLYYDSNNGTTAHFQLRRSDNARLGSLYGYKSGTGQSRIGLLDGDNNAAILHYNDTYTRFYINALEAARISPGSATFYNTNGGNYYISAFENDGTGNAYVQARSDGSANRDAYSQYYTSTDGTDNIYWSAGTDGSDGHKYKINPGSNADSSSAPFVITRTGDVGIGDNAPDGGLKVDISGNIGASAYCDTAGANCTTPAAIATAVGGGGADNLGAGGTTAGTLYTTNGHIGRAGSNYSRWDSSGTTYYYKSGAWRFQMTNGGFYPYVNNTMALGSSSYRYASLHSGTADFTGNVRTTGSFITNNGSPTKYFQDTNGRSAMIHNNSNLLYVLRGSGTNSLGWSTFNGVWPLVINLENNYATFGGRVTAPEFVYTSDRRYKKDIEPLLDATNVLSLGTYEFNWKQDAPVGDSEKEAKDIGLIAQEVEEYYPEFVSEDEDGYKSVDYIKLIVPLLEVTKQQQKQIEELQIQINQLNNYE